MLCDSAIFNGFFLACSSFELSNVRISSASVTLGMTPQTFLSSFRNRPLTLPCESHNLVSTSLPTLYSKSWKMRSSHADRYLLKVRFANDGSHVVYWVRRYIILGNVKASSLR